MNISDEVVEESARAVYRNLMPWPCPIWAELGPMERDKYLRIARVAIETASSSESQPEPCEYCSISANALKVHGGSCDDMTEQEWRELRGEGSPLG